MQQGVLMLKKLFITTSILLSTIGLSFGQAVGVTKSEPLQISNLSILSTNESIATVPVQAGEIVGLIIGITNANTSATNSIGLLVQLLGDGGLTRTIYTNSAVTATTEVYPVTAQCTTTGVATNGTRFYTYGEKLQVTAYNGGLSTNTVLRVIPVINNY